MRKIAHGFLFFAGIFLCALAANAQSPATFTVVIPAGDTAYTDSAGNASVVHIPVAITIGQLTYTPASPVLPPPLPNGHYWFSFGTYGIECDAPVAWAYVSGNPGYPAERYTWNGTTLSCDRNTPNYKLKDARNGTVVVNATGDSFQILKSGAGYTIKDLTTGNYLGLNANNALVMGATQTVWSATLLP